MMDMQAEKRYVRIEAVIYVELGEKETPEDGEDRFLDSLPSGIDCVSYRSSMWFPDEELEE